MSWWESAPLAQEAGGSNWWEAAPLADAGPKKYGIDWSRPVEEVRADVAKLPEAEREEARRQWADSFVAKERETGGIAQTVDDTVRTLARGSFAGPFLDEAQAALSDPIAAARAAYSGQSDPGSAGYYEGLAYQRAQDRAVDTEAPVMSTVGKLAGGLAGGVGAVRTGVMNAPVSATLAGGPLAMIPNMGSRVGNALAGAGVGAAYAGAAGFGVGEDGADSRMETAQEVAPYGAALGAVAPTLVEGAGAALNKGAEVASPLMARAAGMAKDLRNRAGFPKMSVTGAPPNEGAQAAGEQIIANQLSRANVRPDQLRGVIDASENASRFHSSGRAQNPIAVVDTDESLTRLAGSMSRQQPEVSSAAQSFNYARQTGYTPEAPLPANANLITRDRLAALPRDAKPAGQFERVADALKRALRIEDTKAHGHAGTARLTDKQIIKQASDEAKGAYGSTYKAGAGVDLTDTVAPVMKNWSARLADEPAPVANRIEHFMKQINRAVTTNGQKSHIERLDMVKRYMDAQIEKLMPKTGPTDRYLASTLTNMKNELIDQLDQVKVNNIGSLYKAARDQFSDNMSMREAIDAGRRVFADDAEETVETFLALPTRGQQNLYKLGLHDSFVKNMGRKQRTHDVTGIFETPRIQGILREVIERTKDDGGVFANRPERFGNYVANEQRMRRTANTTHGNSMTARNQADDEALNGLQTMIEEVKRNPSASGLAMRAMENLLDRFFGVRPDTAAAIARMLYTTEPATRARILSAIEQRMGPSRMSQFTQEMARYHRAITQAGSVTGGSNAGQ